MSLDFKYLGDGVGVCNDHGVVVLSTDRAGVNHFIEMRKPVLEQFQEWLETQKLSEEPK